MGLALVVTVGTLLTWLGYALALRAAYQLATKNPGLPVLLAAAFALLVGSTMTAAGFSVPLIWPIMPFAAWGCLACFLIGLARLAQMLAGGRGPSVLGWVIAAAAFAGWYLLVPDRKIEIVTGSIRLSLPAAVAMVLSAVSVALATAYLSRRAVARTALTQAALILGSLLFALPLLWLLLTSFKADTTLSPGLGMFWIPKIQETAMLRGRQVPLVRVDGMRAKEIATLPDGHKQVLLDDGRELVVAEDRALPIERSGVRVSNYSDALDYLPVDARRGLTYLENTVIVAVLSVIGGVLSSALVAYAFARMRFPGRDALFGIMLSTMMLPGAVTKLPQFMIFSRLGWIDTLYPLWVPAFFGSALAIFLLRQFFRRVPQELEDAAKIDGAGYLRCFWSVMLPQVKPGLAVVALVAFIGAWNNFLDPLIYAASPDRMTISYALQLYASDRLGEPGLLAAFAVMSILPVVVLFWFGQRFLGGEASGVRVPSA